MDRAEVHCTTYQMRNFFKQFADGVISELDVHCYAQHMTAASLLPKDGVVLDVCCGRGLLIPLLRYRGKAVGGYVGVDIAPKNAVWRDGHRIPEVAMGNPTGGFPLFLWKGIFLVGRLFQL